jgi:hypothetical protein
MGTKIPIVVLDRFYIPEEHVDPNRLEKLFHKTIFDERMCGRCEFQDQRPCGECEGCDGLKANFYLWNEKEIDGKRHIGLPVGNQKQVKKLIRNRSVKIDDQRSDGKELDPRIKFNWSTLYKYQKKAVNKLIDRGYL